MFQGGTKKLPRKKTASNVLVIFILAVFCVLCLFTVCHQAWAQEDFGLSIIEEGVPVYGPTDLRVIIARIIQIFFGVLGIIAVAIIFYAGILWMTSAGNEETVTKAKRTLTNAVIGLVIIFAAFAIVSFILYSWTGDIFGRGGATTASRPEIGIGSALGAGIIESHYPERDQRDVARNTKIAVTFKEPIDLATMIEDTNGNGILGDCEGTNCDLIGPNIVIKPQMICNGGEKDGLPCATSAYCGGENQCARNDSLDSVPAGASATDDKLSFIFKPTEYLGTPTEATWYTVLLGAEIKKADGDYAFGDFEGYDWSFEVSTVVDITPPQVESVFPIADSTEPRNVVVMVNFNEPVDPISASGFVSQGFSNVQVIDEANAPVSGSYIISNRYKTVELQTEDLCGINSCGQNVYCLPGGQLLDALVRAATLDAFNAAGEYYAVFADGYDGIADMAGNSLDGNADGRATGPETDSYNWGFNTTDEVDITPPIIISTNPFQLQNDVLLGQVVQAIFNKILLPSSINSTTLKLFQKVDTADGYTFEFFNYWTGKTDDFENKKTTALIFHDDLLINEIYKPEIGSGIRDIYQNCYSPCRGPICPDETWAQDYPSCGESQVTMAVEMAQEICGDGIVQGAEQCDTYPVTDYFDCLDYKKRDRECLMGSPGSCVNGFCDGSEGVACATDENCKCVLGNYINQCYATVNCELDSDNDGLNDCLDCCPYSYNPEQFDKDALVGISAYSQIGHHVPPDYSTGTMTFTMDAINQQYGIDTIQIFGQQKIVYNNIFNKIFGIQFAYAQAGAWIELKDSSGDTVLDLIGGFSEAMEIGKYSIGIVNSSEISDSAGYYITIKDKNGGFTYIGEKGTQFTTAAQAQAKTIKFGADIIGRGDGIGDTCEWEGPACGNEFLEPGEDCDPGLNGAPLFRSEACYIGSNQGTQVYTCSADNAQNPCEWAAVGGCQACGDGIVQANEDCDGGQARDYGLCAAPSGKTGYQKMICSVNTDCQFVFDAADSCHYCGDGVVNALGNVLKEDCDEGILNGTDASACEANCKWECKTNSDCASTNPCRKAVCDATSHKCALGDWITTCNATTKDGCCNLTYCNATIGDPGLDADCEEEAACGNLLLEVGEKCECLRDEDNPSTPVTYCENSALHRYAGDLLGYYCDDCLWTGGYCGDGITQPEFETCDFPDEPCDYWTQVPLIKYIGTRKCVNCGATTDCSIGTQKCGDGYRTGEELCDKGMTLSTQTVQFPLPGGTYRSYQCKQYCNAPGELYKDIDGTIKTRATNLTISSCKEYSPFNQAICGTCGDGIKNGVPIEKCDEGSANGTIYGACNSTCTDYARCGDGIKQEVTANYEQCDLGDAGNSLTGACGPNCTLTYCGDAMVQKPNGRGLETAPGSGTYLPAFSERCDGGNLDGKNCTNYGSSGGLLKCKNDCTVDLTDCAMCGNARLEEGEQCECPVAGQTSCQMGGTGPADPWACVQCQAGGGYCGNGAVDPLETCDPPGATATPCVRDGYNGFQICSNICQSTCEPFELCGDGIIQSAAGEVCDDGILNGWYNQCGANCQSDPGKYCGDGTIDEGYEVCDLGARNNWLEADWIYTTTNKYSASVHNECVLYPPSATSDYGVNGCRVSGCSGRCSSIYEEILAQDPTIKSAMPSRIDPAKYLITQFLLSQDYIPYEFELTQVNLNRIISGDIYPVLRLKGSPTSLYTTAMIIRIRNINTGNMKYLWGTNHIKTTRKRFDGYTDQVWDYDSNSPHCTTLITNPSSLKDWLISEGAGNYVIEYYFYCSKGTSSAKGFIFSGLRSNQTVLRLKNVPANAYPHLFYGNKHVYYGNLSDTGVNYKDYINDQGQRTIDIGISALQSGTTYNYFIELLNQVFCAPNSCCNLAADIGNQLQIEVLKPGMGISSNTYTIDVSSKHTGYCALKIDGSTGAITDINQNCGNASCYQDLFNTGFYEPYSLYQSARQFIYADDYTSYYGGEPKKNAANFPDININKGTISLWLKPLAGFNTGSRWAMDLIGYSNPGEYIRIWYNANADKWSFDYAASAALLNESLIPAGVWTYAVMTWDTSLPSYQVKVYINGMTNTGMQIEQIDKWDTSAVVGNLVIGARRFDLDRAFHGNIDDIRIYNKALTNTEIQNLFTYPLNEVAPNNLIAHWDLNEGDNAHHMIHDKSGNGHNLDFHTSSVYWPVYSADVDNKFRP